MKRAKILKEDEEFRETWVANIAMAYKDCYAQYKQKTGKKVMNKTDRHIIANNAANYFTDLLCDTL